MNFQKPQSQSWDNQINNPPTDFQYQDRQQTSRQYSYEPQQRKEYYKDNPSYQSSISFDNSNPTVYKRELGRDHYEAREKQGL